MYTPDNLTADIRYLPKLIACGIPIPEKPIKPTSGHTGVNTINNNLVSVLNAGWYAYYELGYEFAKNHNIVGKPDIRNLSIRRGISQLLTKSIDLMEVTTRWSDAKKAIS
jgi:hypothetical protein